jgi:hypothetical protein
MRVPFADRHSRMDAPTPSPCPPAADPSPRWTLRRVIGSGAGVLVIALLFGLPQPINVAPLALLLLSRLVVWGVPRVRQLLRQTATDTTATWARLRSVTATTWPSFMPPPVLQIGWLLAIALGLLGSVLAILWPASSVSSVTVESTLWFGVTVGALDVVVTAWALLRWSVGRRIGLTVVTLGAAVSTAMALSLARKAVFALTGEEPGAFPASQTLFAALLAPVAWAFLLAVLALMMSWPFSIAGAIRLLLAPKGNAVDLLDDFLRFLRPVLLCLIPFMALSALNTTDFTQITPVRNGAQWAIIKLDYWDRTLCNGLRGLSNRIDDRHVSVVLKDAAGTHLRTIHCPADPTP